MRFLSLTYWFSAAFLSRSVNATAGNPTKFLIMTAPRDGKVSYTRVRPNRGLKGREGVVETLISTGLVHPQGLAVDQKRGRLLVTDPDSRKIFAYKLDYRDGVLTAGTQTVAADDVEARWVAVDGIGNVFFSDEPQNKIMKIPSTAASLGNTTAQTAFDGASMMQVSSPGGIAVDSFHAFWVNKQTGMQTGSVVRGLESTPTVSGSTGATVSTGASILQLSKNTDKSYGVCLALSNVYYTQPEKTIFGVKKAGGDPVTISDRLVNPRGCAWDGDGTVYVADRGADCIWSFAGNMKELSLAQMTKAVGFSDAFGVAVFSHGSRTHLLSMLAAVVCFAAFGVA